jgi:trk system potassium uptake protein TrkA
MKVIVIGCGRVGAELAQAVARKGGEVSVIDRDLNAFQRLGVDFIGHTIQGDVMDEAVLRRAGIAEADGLAAVTPSDQTNLVAGRIAHDVFGVPNIVARVYDPIHAQVFQRAGLQTVISSSWSARRIEHLLLHPGLTEIASIGNGELNVIEVRVPEHMAGNNLVTLEKSTGCRSVALVRGGQARLGQAEMVLEEGDLLVVCIQASDLPHLQAAIEPEES